MKVAVEVKDRNEAVAVRTAWQDPTVRAFVVVLGTLMLLQPRSRARVLTYVNDLLNEEAEYTREVDNGV